MYGIQYYETLIHGAQAIAVVAGGNYRNLSEHHAYRAEVDRTGPWNQLWCNR
jgi:hypothetical protein